MKFCLVLPANPIFLVSVLVAIALGGCSEQSAEDHFASAQSYIASSDEAAAVIELKNALKKASSHVDARIQLADLLFASGDYRAAEADYGRAIDGLLASEPPEPKEPAEPTEPTEADNQLLRRLVFARQLCKVRVQRAAEVISELDPVVDSSNRSPGASKLRPDQRALLGHARLALGDIELAAQEFSESLAVDGQLALAHFGQALIAWRKGDFEFAASSFEQAVNPDTRDPQLLLSKADFELSQRDLASARNTLSLAQALPGNDVPARLRLAQIKIMEEYYTRAMAELDSILLTSPQLLPAVYLQALVAYKQGEFDSARLLLRRVLSGQSDYGQALYLLGALQFQQEEFVLSETNLSSYLKQNPDSEAGRRLLGAVRMQTKNYEGVIAALKPLELETQDAQTLAMLGSAYAKLGQINKASEYLNQAVTLSPNVGELRNKLAVTLLATGDSAEAIGQLESAIELDSELQLSDYLLVLAQLRNGDVDEALSSAQALREKSPKDPMGDNLLGAVRFTQGDIAAARNAFESALTKNAAFQPAALNLARLELADGRTEAAFAALQSLLKADRNNESALLELAKLELSAASSSTSPTARGSAMARAKAHLRHSASVHSNSLPPKLALARLGLLERDAAVALDESAKAFELAPNNVSVLSVRIDALLLAGKSSETQEPLRLLEQRLERQAVPNHSQLIGLARLFEKVGQTDKARNVYQRLERPVAQGSAVSGSQVSAEVRDEAKLALLQFDLRDGDVERARAGLTEVGEGVRTTHRYRLLSADVALAEGNTDEARREFEALLDTGNRAALFRLVALHSDSGDPQRADELLANWIRDHPQDAEAEMVLGTNRLGRGDLTGAQQRFEAVLKDSPNNVVVLNNLAWLYQQTGDSRARGTAERAWELAPANADVADTYGWILVGGGDLERGSDVLIKAHKLAPGNLSIGVHAASALAQLGRTEQALAILNEFRLPEASSNSAASPAADSPDETAALALLRKLVAVDEIEAEPNEVNEFVE